MDDRAVNILENYECKVLRTWKGRGAILFESSEGLKILKEFSVPKEKVVVQDKLLTYMKEQGIPSIEQIVRNKEGELLSYDMDKTAYIVKDYFEGRECNVRDANDCANALVFLAKLHKGMELNGAEGTEEIPVFSLEKEYTKHNRELKRIRNFVKQKGQKSNFEVFLLKHFNEFAEKAQQVQEELEGHSWDAFYAEIQNKTSFCHGDYHYHNVLSANGHNSIINFEKCTLDSKVRDIYLFMRKVLEKSDWSIDYAKQMLAAYQRETPLTNEEKLQLYYRFAYPEKFWKIVNFYYNSGKAFISSRNMEKLEKLRNNQGRMETFLSILKKDML